MRSPYLDPLMQFSLGLIVVSHVLCDQVILLLPHVHELLLAVRPTQVRLKVASDAVVVVVDVLPLVTHVPEDVLAGAQVGGLSVFPVRGQRTSKILNVTLIMIKIMASWHYVTTNKMLFNWFKVLYGHNLFQSISRKINKIRAVFNKVLYNLDTVRKMISQNYMGIRNWQRTLQRTLQYF